MWLMSPEGSHRAAILIDEPSDIGRTLGFSRYSSVLAQLIKNSPPHFSVGIFGAWGTGKSTLMRLIKEKFNDDPDILPVWFNPWRFENEEYLAVVPLLRTIRLSLDEYVQRNPSSRPRKIKFLRESIEFSLGAFLNATSLSVGIKGMAEAKIDFSKIVNSFKVGNLPGSETNTIYYHSMDYLQKALSKFGSNFRIVVFVDDVDRCTPQKGFEVLESIKSLFDMQGIVFIIGMNNESIDYLIEQKFGKKMNGFDYLKKIVQLPFQMPKWTKTDISDYLDSLIRSELLGSDFQRGFSAPARKLLISAIEANPREVKRFINNIILAQLIFKKDIEQLIAVNALRFRHEWNGFLIFIARDDKMRRQFFRAYASLRGDEKALDISKDDLNLYYPNFFNETDSIRQFLNDGGADILGSIDSIEKYMRALDSTDVNRASSGMLPGALQTSVELYAMGILIRYEKEEFPNKSPGDDQYYRVTVWIEAPPTIMKEIRRVKYLFPHTFSRQFHGELCQTLMSPPHRDFKFAFHAKGSFVLEAGLEFKNGKMGKIERFLEIASRTPIRQVNTT